MENQSKKIVMFCDFYGNYQTYQENYLSKYYNKLGYKVVILASTNDNIFDYVKDKHDNTVLEKIEVDDFGSKVYRLPYSINIKNKIKKFGGVLEILNKEMPDMLYVHGIHFNLTEAVEYKKKNPKCRIIFDFHADYTNSASNWLSLNVLHKCIRKNFLYRYKKYISKIYPVTPGSLEFLEQVYGISKNEMEILPLGCDTDYIDLMMNNADKYEIKKQLNIGNDDFVVFTGGKLNDIKKTHIAVEAFLEANMKNSHLIIIGKAENSDYDSLLKKTAGGHPYIHFIGWVDTKRSMELMYISDVALFPSGQSVLWQQCIGMYLPLITGDLGGQNMDYLNKNDNLIKVNTENINPAFFAEILKDLYKDGDKLRMMRKGAKKTAKEYLDYNTIVKKTITFEPK